MKTTTIKEANVFKDSKNKKVVFFTQIRQAKMVIVPMESTGVSVEEVIEGLNSGIFSIYDQAFIVLTKMNDNNSQEVPDSPKVIAKIESMDTYISHFEEKDFRKA